MPKQKAEAANAYVRTTVATATLGPQYDEHQPMWRARLVHVESGGRQHFEIETEGALHGTEILAGVRVLEAWAGLALGTKPTGPTVMRGPQ